MRGPGGGSPTSIEPRHRLSVTNEDTSKRRSFGSRDFKDGEKSNLSFNSDRNTSCKFSTLKLVLVIIILGAFLTLLHSPAVYNTERPSHSGSRSGLVETDKREISYKR